MRMLPLYLLSPIFLLSSYLVRGESGEDWPVYLGGPGSTQYSSLDQLTPENVSLLEVAWQYNAGGAAANNTSQIQCNPLVIDGIVYGTSPTINLFALDGETGEPIWEFDPAAVSEISRTGLGVNRGLTAWTSPDGGDARILYANNRFLWALDRHTGKPIPDFGDRGKVDLREGLGRPPEDLFVLSNTPGGIFEDLIIVPTRVSEGPGPSAPGFIRAYNVVSGALAWTFKTIPGPGEPGYETWMEDSWKTVGGANMWTGMAIDTERGIAFCPTGSAAFDFWGGDRLGDNLFANCLLALDARTGERLWHFQFVRHDLWDRDLPSPPNLVTLRRGGEEIPAVAQTTKSGHVFIFHRETGEPLFPIEEVPVPASDLRGEVASPTQPLPSLPKPFARQVFSADLITDISPESRRAVLEQFARVRPHTPFMPPSTEGTIIFPGFDGGAEWGGAAVAPDGVMVVNSNEMPWILTMVELDTGQSRGRQLYMQNCAGCHGVDLEGSLQQNMPSLVDLAERMDRALVADVVKKGQGVMPGFGFLDPDVQAEIVDYLLDASGGDSASGANREAIQSGQTRYPYTHNGYRRWLDPHGYPAVMPPWGTLNAIDLNTGEHLWQVPLGEFPELTERGIPKTGTENYGGPVVTAGNLIFIAATKDEHIRAFDRRTGEELWKAQLPAGGYATPATYMIHGRQYVVIACGGGKMGTASGDAYVAFALPEGLVGR